MLNRNGWPTQHLSYQRNKLQVLNKANEVLQSTIYDYTHTHIHARTIFEHLMGREWPFSVGYGILQPWRRKVTKHYGCHFVKHKQKNLNGPIQLVESPIPTCSLSILPPYELLSTSCLFSAQICSSCLQGRAGKSCQGTVRMFHKGNNYLS